ncbi:hypothetical protein MAP00_002220 [Monascus purpureus]|nr:hypothetical protein MAP00_002220 [Monascus purpureus]
MSAIKFNYWNLIAIACRTQSHENGRETLNNDGDNDNSAIGRPVPALTSDGDCLILGEPCSESSIKKSAWGEPGVSRALHLLITMSPSDPDILIGIIVPLQNLLVATISVCAPLRQCR